MTGAPESTRAILWRKYRRSLLGTGLFVVGFAVTIYLAMQTSTTEPPTAAESGLLVVLAAVFQAGSIYVFNGAGRADPSLARTAVRRLIELTARAKAARIHAESTYEAANAAESKRVMGLISVELSYIEEGIAGAAKDWAEFHPDAIKKLEETDQ